MPRSARLLAPALLALCLVPAASDADSVDRSSGAQLVPDIRLSLDAPSEIAQDSARLRGTIDSDFSAVTVRFQYGTGNTLNQGTTVYNSSGLGTGRFSLEQFVGGLAPNTTYLYRVMAKPYGDANDSDPRYSETRSFVTGSVTGSSGSGSSGSGSGSSGSGSGGSGSSGSGGSSGPGPGILAPLPLPALPVPPSSTPDDATDDHSSTPAPASSQPASSATPEAGQSVAVAPSKGTVLVRRPGTGEYVELAAGSAVPMGSVVDTRRGQVALTSEMPGGKTQTGYFNGGLFLVRQSGDGTVNLYLKGPVCRRPARNTRRGLARAAFAHAAAKPGRRLFGRDHGGKFRTHGRNSHATVRGTRWMVEDRCDGTLTKVSEGAVMVRDLTTKRRVLVKAGGRYLARAHR